MKSSKKNIDITLPDGKVSSYVPGITGKEIAKDISLSLSKKAIAIKVNGEQRDLSDHIYSNSKIQILTLESQDGIEIMRHTIAAQVLAKAIKNLFPESKLAIGPTIENGFYYDVLFKKKISIDELQAIENEMKRIVKKGGKIIKKYRSKQESIEYFENKRENYKVDIINQSDQHANFQMYEQEDGNFIDLCKGPHLPDLKFVGAFKLTKLAGAYWRGDSKNEMLQRIYGTAWKNEKDLQNYLNFLDEAEKRDHRKIGKDLELFHLQEHAPGSVFWHPKGWFIYRSMMEYMRLKLTAANYKEVNTPQLVDSSLWKDSGHWEKFREHMFVSKSEDKVLAIKPMNCPCHVQIFRQGIKSYKDLPLRMAEFGSCHRNEPSGALHGLMRVRAFTQDDAHIFCTEEQIISETETFCKLLMDIYSDFGFKDIQIKFSDRPEKRAGENSIWDKAEKSLKEAVEISGLKYSLNPGEGAFYGPKLEFILKDAIGREWQCGTLQVDFVLPERLDASYIAADGSKQRPVLLHRAVLGSFERFIGILIENDYGRLPNWLLPTQAVVININEDCLGYANEITEKFKKVGIRCFLDKRKEKINYKIREHSSMKIPYQIVVGKKEIEEDSLSVRILGQQKISKFSTEEFLKIIKKSCSMPKTMSY